MRYSQAEKREIIRLVEASDRSVSWTLKELGIARSTFYEWYRRYQDEGYEGLANRSSQPEQTWNRIPNEVREQVVETALRFRRNIPSTQLANRASKAAAPNWLNTRLKVSWEDIPLGNSR